VLSSLARAAPALALDRDPLRSRRGVAGLTSGVHTPEDVVKSLMAGADIGQHLLALAARVGSARSVMLVDGLQRWMDEHEYESVAQMKGALSQQSVAEPAAFERPTT